MPSRGRSALGLGLLVIGCMTILYLSVPVQTMIINHQRQHAMELFRAAFDFSTEIKRVDAERAEENKSSIFPADVGSKTARDYIAFLVAGHYLHVPLADPGEFEIGNVGRNDSDLTILVRTRRRHYDVHTMWSGPGEPPRYDLGFYYFRKDGREEFYREKSAFPEMFHPDPVKDPPRDPAYLPDE